MSLLTLNRIRQIARAGDTLRAWRMFEAAGLLVSEAPETLSLKGRLLKDRALRSESADRARLLDQAQEAYIDAAGGRRATYPLINAATIAFLNDKGDQARQIAQQVLELLESGQHEPETRYWLGATAAEAQLLLGNVEASRLALERAIGAVPDAWEDHAATLRQLRQILDRIGGPADMFDHLCPPPSLYFSGIIGLPADEAHVGHVVERALNEIQPGAAFGALAAGADIVIAEKILARGAPLHVILPTTIALFRQISVAQFGDSWSARFDRLIEVADSVEILDRVTSLSTAAVQHGEEAAMGLALRRARILATHVVALHVGRASDVPKAPEVSWRGQGLPFHEIIVEEMPPPVAMELAVATSRTIIASARSFPVMIQPLTSKPELSMDGYWVVEVDDLATGMDLAVEILRVAPDTRLGLDYRAVSPDEDLEQWGELAMQLARAAPEGGICAPWPCIAAMNLYAPHHTFETAGEIVTPIGDFPVGLFCLPSAA